MIHDKTSILDPIAVWSRGYQDSYNASWGRWEAVRSKRVAGGVDDGPYKCLVRLFTTEAILKQTLGNSYHFIKLIYRIKDALTMKQPLNALSRFIVIIFRAGLSKQLKNAFCRVGRVQCGISGTKGAVPGKQFGNYCCRGFDTMTR
jgi:hypothetical protein